MSLDEKSKIEEIYNHVIDYFKGDVCKTRLWFETPNPLLGQLPPIEFIKVGRTETLYKFIKNVKEGNYP